MKLTVQFYSGLALRLSRQKSVLLELQDGATLRDVAAELVRQIPDFVGALILPETNDLVGPHVFHVKGRAAPSLDEDVHEGDRIWLLSVTAGG